MLVGIQINYGTLKDQNASAEAGYAAREEVYNFGWILESPGELLKIWKPSF